MHPFRRTSQILRFVSKDPLAKNSPKGWKSTETQLLLCPASVRTARCASRSKSFSVPPAAPATTASSARSNVTHSTADWWPVKERMGLGLPIANRFTRLSSPPVTITPADLRPIFKQFTADSCAGNSWGDRAKRRGGSGRGVSGWDGDGESRERGPDAGGTSARRVDRAETPRGARRTRARGRETRVWAPRLGRLGSAARGKPRRKAANGGEGGPTWRRYARLTMAACARARGGREA